MEQMRTYTTEEMIQVVKWAAQECEWQDSGEMSVPGMVTAYLYTHDLLLDGGGLGVGVIKLLGSLVEPDLNPFDRFRGVDVTVGGNLKMPHSQV